MPYLCGFADLPCHAKPVFMRVFRNLTKGLVWWYHHINNKRAAPIRAREKEKNMNANEANEKIYAAVTDKIIAQMETGVIPWKKGWKAISGSYNAKSKRFYSFINQMILWTKPGAYASFKQWNELGCKVKKGAKAEFIMEWFSKEITYTAKNKDGEEEEVKYRKWYPRMYPVFHSSQVEGWTEPEAEEIKAADPIREAEELIEAYKTFSGIKSIITDKESSKAFYSPVSDYIQVPKKEQFSDIAEYYSTLFHEMTHSTGHSSRLDRGLDKMPAAFGTDTYSKEELVAELGAAMIMTRLEIDTPETFTNSAAYLQGWLKALKNDKSLLISAASYAEAATRYIFNER